MESTLLNYGDGPRAIYEVLKQQIISGKLEAGSELKIMTLANELGVSIVPIREAIRILATEDLVVLRPRRSPIKAIFSRSISFVRPWSRWSSRMRSPIMPLTRWQRAKRSWRKSALVRISES